jgi:glutamate racemase
MRPIGVFDSGVGGISVLQEIASLLPAHDLIYVADTAYVPYGTRTAEDIQRRALAVVTVLVDRFECGVVVVASNTATTHAVDLLRERFPGTPIVGMEPAVKPAAAASRSRVVGVLATGATLEGERFAALARRFTDNVELLTQPCPGLVERVEEGDLDGPHTMALLREYTAPLLARGADTLVLGCTHYPFLRDTLRQIVGQEVAIIDTGSAVARRTAHVIADRESPEPGDGTEERRPGGPPRRVSFYTTGDPGRARPVIERLWGHDHIELHRLEV